MTGPLDRGRLIAFLTRLLFGIYFIEAGLLLVIGPWTEWWTRNFFANTLPGLQAIMAFSATRVAVVLIGLVTMVGGIVDVRQIVTTRMARRRQAVEAHWTEP